MNLKALADHLKNAELGPFTPKLHYSHVGDRVVQLPIHSQNGPNPPICVTYYFRDVSSYSVRIDESLTVFRASEDDSLVGIELKLDVNAIDTIISNEF